MADARRHALRLPAVLLSLWISGCASLLPAPQPAPSRFDLGPWPATELVAPELAGVSLKSLQAPSWLQIEQIAYRQLHVRPEALRHYAVHAWVAAPAELLRFRLEQLLAADAESARPWRLEVELLRFEQVFLSADDAEATIMLRASLRKRGDDAIAQRSFRAATAVSADVDGAIEGLPKVADTALRELVAWAADVILRRGLDESGAVAGTLGTQRAATGE